MERIARTPEQIGEAIRQRRSRLGWNQTKLAEKTGLRQSTVSEVERGKSGALLGTICDLLAALDLELVIRPRSKAAPEIEDIF